MVLANILTDIPRRTPELGRIRLGEKSQNGAPIKLRTFRLTSHSKALLEAAAALYGGAVKAWDGAPDEGMWQVTTAASELDVMIPGAAGAISQSYEMWKGGTCERRCDGTTDTAPDEPRPCVCRFLGQKGADMDCEIVTRFRVILPRVPGLGTWMLTTSGYQAATTLPSTLEMLAKVAPSEWIAAVLRAEQRSTKVRLPNGKVQTNRFVVPVLDLPNVTIGALAVTAGLVDVPQIEAPAPLTAKDRAAAARAAIEARSTTSDDTSQVVVDATPVPAGPRPVPAAEPDRTAGEAAGTTKPVRCDGFHEEMGRCCKEMGHEGGHRNPQGAWPR